MYITWTNLIYISARPYVFYYTAFFITFQGLPLFDLKFVPTSDNKSKTPFLANTPSKFGDYGIDLPILIGFNSEEGILKNINEFIARKYRDDFQKTLIEELKMKSLSKVAARDLRRLYFGNGEITKEKRPNFVEYFGDALMVNGIHLLMEIQSKKTTPSYLYRFSYRASGGTFKKFLKIPLEGMHVRAEQTRITVPYFNNNFVLIPIF